MGGTRTKHGRCPTSVRLWIATGEAERCDRGKLQANARVVNDGDNSAEAKAHQIVRS